MEHVSDLKIHCVFEHSVQHTSHLFIDLYRWTGYLSMLNYVNICVLLCVTSMIDSVNFCNGCELLSAFSMIDCIQATVCHRCNKLWKHLYVAVTCIRILETPVCCCLSHV